MGLQNALSMAAATDDLRLALHWHLQSNHYPPVPATMIDPCIDAIDAVNEDDPDRRITLPEGILYRGREDAPAWAIVEAHHLYPWLYEGDE